MEPERPEKLIDIQPTKPKPKRIKKEQTDTSMIPLREPVSVQPTPAPVKKPRKKTVETKQVETKPRTRLVKGSEAAKLRMQELRELKRKKKENNLK